jgi:hypothetical protein
MLIVAFPYCYAELHYDECRMLSVFMLNLSVVVLKVDLLLILLRCLKGAIGRQ